MKRANAVLSKLPLLNIFSTKKLIRNQVVNRLGAQPFRIWLADRRYALRRKFLTKAIEPYIDTLQREGIVVIPDFLPLDEFEALEQECLRALDKEERTKIRQDGPNLYTNIRISELQDYNVIQRVSNHSLIEQLFKAAERRNVQLREITRLLSCLIQGEDNGTTDPETALHEDTFFNTHKAWLYVSDVEAQHAPFVYVKGSHDHKTTNRYKKAYAYSLDKNNIHSRRIPPEELSEMGLTETLFTARKNTFVMANTLGFHRRIRGKAGNKRIALAFSARHNPFL